MYDKPKTSLDKSKWLYSTLHKFVELFEWQFFYYNVR